MPKPDIPWLVYSAAVFRAVSGCDHLDYHGGPFRVVFMATDEDDDLVEASLYSSETLAWSTPITLDYGFRSWEQRWQAARGRGEFYHEPYVMPRRGALVGDEIYFTLRKGNAIIKYNWGMNCLSTIDPPSSNVYGITLMEMENGSLGFACIEGSILYVWSRKVNSEGAAEWVQYRVIELEKIVPSANLSDEAFVVGSAEGVGVIFMSTDVGLFTIELKSRRVKKVEEPEVYFSVLPYMSFYTPVSFRSWHIVIASEDSLIFDVTLKSNMLQNVQICRLESAAIDFFQSYYYEVVYFLFGNISTNNGSHHV